MAQKLTLGPLMDEAFGPGSLVFVYGTLRTGERNNYVLAGASESLGPAVLIPEGNLYDLGTYPGLKLEAGKDKVFGEVFRLTGDRVHYALDYLEGYPSLYDRVLVDVEGLSGPMKCWTYIYQYPVQESQLIKGGDWVSHYTPKRMAL